MAKIAVELGQAVARRAAGDGRTEPLMGRTLAKGDGWSVEDLVCTRGCHDRPFEERHSGVSIAIVLAGTFQYRTTTTPRGDGQLMTPGALLLGNPGQMFECGHAHGAGDRCLSFHFAPQYFERIAADAGARRSERAFRIGRLPAVRELSPVIARASAGMARAATRGLDTAFDACWEEVGLELAARSIRTANCAGAEPSNLLPGAMARVTRVVRRLEEDPGADPSIRAMARDAGLSPYHFLRTFEQLTGVTPHRYVRRARLRRAAAQLLAESGNILDIAMECGFGDVSNFNRAFHSEFGTSPRQFRRRASQSR